MLTELFYHLKVFRKVLPKQPSFEYITKYLAPVVQRLDNAIHWINCHPVDKC